MSLNKLPECMMPDGAPPCEAYQELYDQNEARMYAIVFLISRLSSTGKNIEINYEDFKLKMTNEINIVFKGANI